LSLLLGKSSACQRAPSNDERENLRHRSSTLRQQFTADVTLFWALLPGSNTSACDA
jgi:hypothetical protein